MCPQVFTDRYTGSQGPDGALLPSEVAFNLFFCFQHLAKSKPTIFTKYNTDSNFSGLHTQYILFFYQSLQIRYLNKKFDVNSRISGGDDVDEKGGEMSNHTGMLTPRIRGSSAFTSAR